MKNTRYYDKLSMILCGAVISAGIAVAIMGGATLLCGWLVGVITGYGNMAAHFIYGIMFPVYVNVVLTYLSACARSFRLLRYVRSGSFRSLPRPCRSV